MLTAEKLIQELCSAHGPSGFESDVAERIHRLIHPYVDEVRRDFLGNLIALKRGHSAKASLMIAGHMDEIGFLVSGQEDEFLQIAAVGGLDPRVLPGQEVWVHGQTKLKGIVASLPPHVLSEEDRQKVSLIHQLYVDVGLSEKALSQQVKVGDPVTLATEPAALKGGCWCGKAMDDRAGLASMILTLCQLKSTRHAWDVCAVATVQEEVGLKGAQVSAFGVEPTAAIAIDVAHGNMPGADEADTVDFRKGPAIAFGPNISPYLFDRLTSTADHHGIPWQREAVPGRSGTDAWAMQVVRCGIPTAILGIPLKYMHTAVETLFLKNVERTARLMTAFASELDEDALENISLKEVDLESIRRMPKDD